MGAVDHFHDYLITLLSRRTKAAMAHLLSTYQSGVAAAVSHCKAAELLNFVMGQSVDYLDFSSLVQTEEHSPPTLRLQSSVSACA